VGERYALVAGATGLVGGHLLDELLRSDAYGRITVLARRPVERRDERVSSLVVDFEHLEDAPAVKGVTDAFCALGTTLKKAGSAAAFRRVDLGYVTAFARLAARSGASRFVLVSSVGADEKSSVLYPRVKGEAEREVRSLSFEAVHILRPSFLLGERSESRPGERAGIVAARALSFALAGPLARYRTIEAGDVARAMVAAALSPETGIHVHEGADLRRLARAR